MAPRISFEFFPPQTLDASFRLWETVRMLAPMAPTFCSVTYGAGGTTRKLTHEAVTTIGKQFDLNVAAHLTCVDATRAETLEIAQSYADAGVTELVALRGDAPKGQAKFTPHPEGFASSIELVEALAATGRFKIRVGAYPEPHPESADTAADVDFLRRKIAAGASSAITQFFFEADTFLRFRDTCAAAGIDAPILPGILPIANWNGVKKFAIRCGQAVPQWLDDKFAAMPADQHEALSIRLCTELCWKLLDEGVQDLHFYTLNSPWLSRDVARALGVQETRPLAPRAA